MQVRSRLNDILRVKENLPQDQKNLFDQLFVQATPNEKICRNLSISPTELAARQQQMMRTLMRAV